MAAGEEIAKLFGTLGFKVDMRGVNKFESRLKRLESRLKSLGQAQSRGSRSTSRGLSEATEKVRRHGKEISNVINRYNKYDAKVQRLREDFRRVNVEHKNGNITLERRNKILNDVIRQYRRAQQEAKDFERYGERGRGRPARLGPQMRGAMSSFVPGIGGGFAAMQSVQAYQNAVGMQQGLTAATGSTEQAAEDFQFLQETAQTLGLYIGDLGKSFTGMSAAARGTSLEGQGVRDVFTGISAQARVLNLSAADQEGIFRAVTQMMNKGQVMAEELKNQLGERMPGAIQATARALDYVNEDGTAAVDELFDAMERGELVAEEVLPLLARESLKMAKTGGALEASMNNTSAAIARFRTNLWNANRIFNEAGFDNAVARLFNRMSEAIVKAEPLWELMGRAAGAFGLALEAPIELAGTLAEKLGFLTEEGFQLSSSFKIAAIAAMSFVKVLRRIGFWFFVLPYAISSVRELIENGFDGKSWQELAVMFGGIALAIGAIAFKLRGAIKLVRRFKDAMRGTRAGDLGGSGGRGRNRSPTPDDALNGNRRRSILGGAGIKGAAKMGLRLVPGVGTAALLYDLAAMATGLPTIDEVVVDAFKSIKGQFGGNNAEAEERLRNGIMAGTSAARLNRPGQGAAQASGGETSNSNTTNLNGDINFYIDGAQDGELIQSQILETINEVVRGESAKNPQVEQ